MDRPLSDVRVRAEMRLHRRLAIAHDEYAQELAALIGSDDLDVPDLKGPVQRRLVGLPTLFSEAGLSAREVATSLNYDEANAYTVLKSLTDAGVLESVEGAKPARWRMAIKHRRNRILRMSHLVPDGRWTTYGDFAIAVYDNVKMAITVGRVAAHNPAFANPHRVLGAGGVIKPDWLDEEGRGPEECARRLGEDGIAVTDGRADPDKFIPWDELKMLLKTHEEAAGLDEAA